MNVSYKKLWKLLIDRDLKKKDLEEMAGVSHYTMNKLTHGDNVTTDVLGRICKALNVTIDEIMEFKAITEDRLAENADVLRENWNSAIHDFSNISTVWTVPDSSLQSELMQVAELIGCKVTFLGEQPKSRKALQLLYAAVREALTNAVRHADATELTVKIKQDKQRYHIEISDNGGVSVSSITEGNGLSALRQRLEQEGATLKVLCDNSVSLLVDIPFDFDEVQKGGRK